MLIDLYEFKNELEFLNFRNELVSDYVDKWDNLDEVPDESIVMIGDITEVPDMRFVPYERMPHSFIVLSMTEFVGSFDKISKEPVLGTVLTTVGNLRRFGAQAIRESRERYTKIPCAGWVLTEFGRQLNSVVERALVPCPPEALPPVSDEVLRQLKLYKRPYEPPCDGAVSASPQLKGKGKNAPLRSNSKKARHVPGPAPPGTPAT
jgi:hypothetical protein